MQTLFLRPVTYNDKPHIGIYFKADAVLNKVLQNDAAARWSRSLRCWHVPLSRDYYIRVAHAVTNLANIDYTALSQYLQSKKKGINKSHLPVTVITKQPFQKAAIQQVAAPSAASDKGSRIGSVNATVIPRMYQHLQLKAYSSSTIRTYLGEMKHLLYMLQDVAADELEIPHLKRYLHYCYEKLKLSENTLIITI